MLHIYDTRFVHETMGAVQQFYHCLLDAACARFHLKGR